MKQILFIMTGGTIASVDNGNGLEPSADNFFAPLVESLECSVRFLAPFTIDSSQVLPAHWAKLGELVNREYPSYDGIVISHGTDTMAYTAAFLSFMLKGIPLPVVLTGSQVPLSAPHSDGAGNAVLAVETACSGLHGVFVAFDGRVMHGKCCSKTYSNHKIGFESINEPYVSLDAASTSVRQYRFNTDYKEGVFLLKAVPTVQPAVIGQIVRMGYHKIVIEAYGKGGLPSGFLTPIQDAINHGVRIGITTQCTYDGSDCYVYKVGRELLSAGVLDYKKHTTEYAIADMMFRK